MYLIQSISEEEVYDLVVDYVNKRENEWKQEICDECDGEGVVTNDDFIEQSCDSCGGEGIIK